MYVLYPVSYLPCTGPGDTVTNVTQTRVTHHTVSHSALSRLSAKLKGINRREESRAQGRDRHALTLHQIVAWITRARYTGQHGVFPHEAITDTWPCLCGTGGEAKLSTEKFTRFDPMIN